MNRSYKVIWNRSLNCFMAVAEYAKSRSKSSSTVVSSSAAVVSSDMATGGVRLLRLSALSVGLVTAGLSISPQVFAAPYAAGGGTANGTDSIAIGTTGIANGSGAIAIGSSALTGVGTGQSIAIGTETKATGDQAVALGANVVASGNSSVAIGGDDIDKIATNTTQAAQYTSITGGTLVSGSYPTTTASGAGASALGVQAVASGNFSTALGMTSKASGAASVALGVNAAAAGQGALAIGAVSRASDTGSVAIGINSRSSGVNSIAIGSGNTATSGANTTGANATAIGSNSIAAANATAIGTNARATIAGGVAIGTGSVANIAAGIAGFDPSIGGPTKETSNVWRSTQAAASLGDSANGITRQLTGLAAGTGDSDAVNVAQLRTVTNQTFKIQANDDTASAVKSSDTVQFVDGKNIKITRIDNGITIATANEITVDSVTATDSNGNTTALTATGTNVTNGSNTSTYGANGLMTKDSAGRLAYYTATQSILNDTAGNANVSTSTFDGIFDAAGNSNISRATGTVVSDKLGNVSNYSATGFTARDTAGNRTLVNQTGLSFVDSTGTATGPSITAAGINAGSRIITNVANGSIAANSTDAINGGQLFDSAEALKTVIGGSAVNTGGLVTTTNIGGTGESTIDGAITNVRDAATKAKATVTEGKNIVVTGTTNLDGSTDYNVKTKDDLALTSVTTGNTITNNAGVTIIGGSKNTVTLSGSGLNNGGNRITSLANGIAEDDAATFGQLTATNANVTDTNNIAKGNLAALGGNAAYDATTGTYTQPIYTLDDGTNTDTTANFSTVGGALSNLDGRTTTNTATIANVQAQANQGFNISAAGGTADNVQLGETVDFTNTDGNLVVTNDGVNGINYDLAQNIDLGATGSIRTGNTVTNNAGVRVDDGNGNITAVTLTGTNVTDGINTSNYGAQGLTTTDGNGNTGNYSAESVFLTDAEGNTSINAARGNVVFDANGNANASIATANGMIDTAGNTNISTATSNTLTDTNSTNITAMTAAGTNVTDGTNSSNYGANGFTATDGTNTTIFNQTGLSFTDTNGATGPSITAAGINAGDTIITNVANGSVVANSKDAVNGGQLNTTNTNVTNNTSAIGDINAGRSGIVRQDAGTGAITVGTQTGGALINIAGTDGTRILTGLSNGNIAANSTDAVTGDQLNTTNNNISSLQSKTFSLQANNDTASAVGQNDTVRFLDGDNIDITRNGNNITVATARDVNFDNVTVGNSQLGNSGLRVSDPFADSEANYTANGFVIRNQQANTMSLLQEGNFGTFRVDKNTGMPTNGSVITPDFVYVGNGQGDGSIVTNDGFGFSDELSSMTPNLSSTSPSIRRTGIDAGNTRITNVADGVNADDAATFGQLTTTNTAVTDTNNIAKGNLAALGGGATYDATTDTYTQPVYTLDDGTNTDTTANFNTVGGALSNLDGRTTTNTATIAKGMSFGDGVTNNNFALGDTINVTGDSNLTSSTTADGVQVTLNKDIDLGVDGSLKTGNTVTNNAGVRIDDGNGNITAVTLKGTNVTDGINTSNYGATGSNITDSAGNTTITSALGTNVTDGNGNIASYTARRVALTDDTGRSNSSSAIGNAISDNQGNTNLSGAIGNAVFDNQGNANLSGARGNIVLDSQGNRTITSASGNTVTDGTNTSRYGAEGLVATDSIGNSTIVNQGGVSFVDVNGDATGPSLTAAGIDAGNNTISNVADGVNADDVATFGQLTATNANVTDTNNIAKGNLAALGGNAAYDATTGTYTQPIYTLDDGTNTDTTANFNTVGGALSNLDGRTTTNTATIAKGMSFGDGVTNNNFALGDTINVTGDSNLTSSTTADGVQVTLNKDIDLGVDGSLKTGNTVTNNAGVRIDDGTNITAMTVAGTNVTNGTNTSNYGANGFTATDAAGNSTLVNQAGLSFINANGATGPSITATGINAGNRIITNVANGSIAANSTDATNGGQLFNTAEALKTVIGGNAVNTGGLVTTTNIGGTGATTIDGAITNVRDAATKAKTTVTEGKNIVVTGTTNLDGSTDYNVKTKDDLALTSVTTGNTITNNAGVTIIGGPVDTVTLGRNGLNNGGNRITNLANGIAADDAATFGQVTNVNNKVDTLGASTATNLGGGATYTAATGTVSAPTYTLDNGTNTGTTANFNNVGDALGNLNSRTTTNTSDIADLASGKTGLVRQDNGTSAITVGAATGGTVVDFTNSKGINRQLTGVASAGDYTVAGNANNAVNAGDLNTAIGNIESTVTDKGLTFASDRGVNVKRKLGETLTITGGETDAAALASGNNIGVSTNATNDGLLVQLAKDIDLGVDGSLKTGNTVTNNAGVRIDDGTNITAMTAAGTNVTNGTNTSNYGANGFTATDGTNTTTFNQNGLSFADANGATGPSITAAGINAGNRIVTNVANGSIAANSTDATNGGQLFNTAEALKTVIGGNAVNTGGLVTTTNIGGTGATTIDGAITNVRDAATKAKTTVTEGKNIVVTGTTNLDGSTDYNVKTKDDLALTSVTTGNTITNNAGVSITDGANITAMTAAGTNVTNGTNTSNYGANGFTATDAAGNSTLVNQAGLSFINANGATGPSITAAGINAAGNKITNIADGTATGDAVNVGQLQATNGAATAKTNALGTSTATNLGGGATYTAATGAVSAPTYTLDNGANTGTTADFNNVGSALGNLDGRTTTNTRNIANVQAQANKGFNVSAAGGTANNVQLGETVDFTNTDGNLVATASGTGINYNLAENIDLGATGSLKIGNTVTNNAGVRIDDGTNITAMTAAGTNVTNGTNTSNYGANGFTATDAAGNSTLVNQAGLSFVNANGATGPSITATGIDAKNTIISNVGAAVNDGDAVNKGQLDAITGNILAGGVQYERNNGNINYDKVIFAGTQAVIDQDEDGKDFVVSGGTRLSNVANGISAADAVNKGQLDSLIAKNITNVEVVDQNGNPVTVNVTDQVVNRNTDNSNMDSLFLTYNVEGQNVTDRLTIGETVQRMNTEGVKFAHTKAVSVDGDLGITNDSSAGGDNSTAIGVNAIIEAGADSTVALGHNTKATADATNSVVIGSGSQVAGQSSIAIGDGAQALGNQSISIGTGNVVNGNNSGAFGDPSIINGDNSYSVGNNNTINSNDTFVLGNNVTSTVGGSVVLGTGSAARTGAGVAGYGAAGNAAITATTSTTGAVAVGDAANGIYRQVTGVAAGTADSDAVNVSQLKAVSDKLQNNNEALSNAAVQYDKNADGTVNKGSITLGGGAAGTTITNVKAGNISAGSTDAINGSQLHNLGSDVASIIGGDATFDAEGNLIASNIGGTGKGNINDAIAAVNNGNAQANADIKANTGRLDAGLSFGADSGNNISKSIGDGTAIKFEGSNNIKTTTTSSGIKFDLNGNISVDNITADTVTTGNTTVSNKGVTIKDGPSMTSEGINASGKTITGVADGIKVNDAVNLGQLNALDNRLSNSVNELGYRINEVEDDANAGVSAAMAMSSLPQAYIPGKSMVGGGIATYNGQSAVAIGLSKVSDNGRWVIKANGTADTQGNAGGAVGAGFHF